jgi:hypothetical protein
MPGNFFQQRMFLCSRAHDLAGWRLPTPSWLTSISQLTRRCYSTAYNNGASSRGDSQLRPVSDCLPPNSKSTRITRPSVYLSRWSSWYILGTDTTESTFLAAAMLQHDVAVATDPPKTPLFQELFHCCVTSLLLRNAFIAPFLAMCLSANVSQYYSLW